MPSDADIEGQADASSLLEEIKKLKQDSLRQMADFDNYRKQLDKEKQEYMKSCNEKLILEILEVVDNFERALAEMKKTDADHYEGVEMIYNQLQKVLTKEGVKPIEAKGRKFDPYLHEAFMRQESDQPDGTIIEEMQKGYMLNNRVIRHSKVLVSKNKEEKNGDRN